MYSHTVYFAIVSKIMKLYQIMAINSLVSVCSESKDAKDEMTFTWNFKQGINSYASQSSNGFGDLMERYPYSNDAVCKNGKNENDDTIKKCIKSYLDKISNAIKKMNGKMGKFVHYSMQPVTDYGEWKAFLFIDNEPVSSESASYGHRYSVFSIIVFSLALVVSI